MIPGRGPLLADESLTGRLWCTTHAALIDRWLLELFTGAAKGDTAGVALVAVGGYGRSELCPESDLDVYLVHGRHDIAALADRLWYPIWDEGLHLGHSVCTVKEALRLAAEDLDTATALLSARHVAGDEAVTADLAKAAASLWERKSRRWLPELGARVTLRHQKAGEVAFALEPDLKEGRGGLRDAHTLAWADAARRTILDFDEQSVAQAYAVLLDARVELQRRTGRASNVLSLQDQSDVASALGCRDADELMGQVAEAARTIAWTSDDTWRRIRLALRGPLGRVTRRNRALDGDVHLRDGEVRLAGDTPPDDGVVVLRAAAAAATHHTSIERATLERLAAAPWELPEPWPQEARDLLLQLLLSGRAAIPVIEALDQRRIWERIVPEWQPVRSMPQRNPYHVFTVDRHLLEAAAWAAKAGRGVARPDLLVMAALLHDIGKGRSADHTEVGVPLARAVARRVGFDEGDVDTIAALVEHHLLLPDVATRRDLDDEVIIGRVADLVGSSARLELLAALTEADGLATGPAAWRPWKADLVALLVDRVERVLAGQGASTEDRFPTPAQLAMLAEGRDRIDVCGDTVTVLTADRPGAFSRVAGVLALHGLDVLSAAARSTDDGRALSQFRVADPVRDATPWDRVIADLESALEGRLALAARLAERARTYHRPGTAHTGLPTRVSFDTDASADATVIDVQTTDRIGVLFQITRAMAEMDLDIRVARVETRGSTVFDAFYVRDGNGEKITDEAVLAEIERALVYSCEGR